MANPDMLLVRCPECGGTEAPTGTLGCGWVLTESGPVLPQADGSRRLPPADTVRPCSRCRWSQYRRWRNGHLPCPKRGPKGEPCFECRRLLGMVDPEAASADEEEHLPAEPAEPVVLQAVLGDEEILP